MSLRWRRGSPHSVLQVACVIQCDCCKRLREKKRVTECRIGPIFAQLPHRKSRGEEGAASALCEPQSAEEKGLHWAVASVGNEAQLAHSVATGTLSPPAREAPERLRSSGQSGSLSEGPLSEPLPSLSGIEERSPSQFISTWGVGRSLTLTPWINMLETHRWLNE